MKGPQLELWLVAGLISLGICEWLMPMSIDSGTGGGGLRAFIMVVLIVAIKSVLEWGIDRWAERRKSRDEAPEVEGNP